MYNNIPVRSDAEVWLEGTDPEYAGRSICQTEMLKVVNDTPAENPNLDVDKLITFLHHGK